MSLRTILAAAAMAGVASLSFVAPASAQSHYQTAYGPSNYGYWGAAYTPRPGAYYGRYGPADPCARNAGNRALGWGLVGLVLGGLAGGAAAATHVVAEGAALGGFVGAGIGAIAGHASARCGTAYQTGLPIVGVTEHGVAIYGPPQQQQQIYDYGAQAAPPAPPAEEAAPVEQAYRDDDCCCCRETHYEERRYVREPPRYRPEPRN